MSDAPVENGQGATGSTSPAPGAPAPAPTTPASWLESADELTRGYIQNKGWQNPLDILAAYRGAEKFISAPVERRVVLPNPEANPETLAKEQADFYNKLGRPADPAGYKIEVPEGAPKEFSQAAAKIMHENGLTKAQGEKLASWWNEQGKAAQDAELARVKMDVEEGQRALQTKWGTAYNQELAKAQNAFRALGITDEQVDALQKTMGHQGTMEFFQKLGNRMGEPDFVSGKSNGFDAMTPEGARSKIAELRSDKEFGVRLLNKDVNARAEWTRLHQFAFPEPQR